MQGKMLLYRFKVGETTWLMQRVLRDRQTSGIDSDSETAGALILFTSATGACARPLRFQLHLENW